MLVTPLDVRYGAARHTAGFGELPLTPVTFTAPGSCFCDALPDLQVKGIRFSAHSHEGSLASCFHLCNSVKRFMISYLWAVLSYLT